jgi:hypothetical protein
MSAATDHLNASEMSSPPRTFPPRSRLDAPAFCRSTREGRRLPSHHPWPHTRTRRPRLRSRVGQAAARTVDAARQTGAPSRIRRRPRTRWHIRTHPRADAPAVRLSRSPPLRAPQHTALARPEAFDQPVERVAFAASAMQARPRSPVGHAPAERKGDSSRGQPASLVGQLASGSRNTFAAENDGRPPGARPFIKSDRHSAAL